MPREGRWLVLLIWIFPWLLGIALAKGGSKAPAGFRGIAWGTRIEGLKEELIFLGRDAGRQLEWYRRKKEDLHLGGARVEEINYIFLRGILHKVSVIARGKENFLRLRDYLSHRYGPCAGPAREVCSWSKGQTSITLVYNGSSDISLLLFQAKQGAESSSTKCVDRGEAPGE